MNRPSFSNLHNKFYITVVWPRYHGLSNHLPDLILNIILGNLITVITWNQIDKWLSRSTPLFVHVKCVGNVQSLKVDIAPVL